MTKARTAQAVRDHSTALSMTRVAEQWVLLEADFHSEYGIELHAVLDDRDWRWFRTRLAGLLAVPTRLSRALATPSTESRT